MPKKTWTISEHCERNMMKSSPEHCLACLTSLRLAMPSGMKEADAKAQDRDWIRRLVTFEPEAVRRGCDEWAEEHRKWPVLSELLDVVRTHENKALKPARAGSSPWTTGESFADRCNRLGVTAMEMAETGVSNYGDIFTAHCSAAGISDEVFAEGWRQVRRGEKVHLRSLEKARRLPQQMAENDRFAADIEANPSRYFAADLMLSIYRQMAARRTRDAA